MIDFTPPFRRISLLDGLKEKGIDIPQPLESEAANQYLRAKVKVKGRENLVLTWHLFLGLFQECGLVCAEPQTTARLIDKLVKKVLFFLSRFCLLTCCRLGNILSLSW